MTRILLALNLWMIVSVPAMAGWVRRYEPLKGSRVEALESLSDGGVVVLSGGLQNVLFTTNAVGDVVAARELERQAWFAVRGSGDTIFVGGAQLSINDGPELQVAKLDSKLAVTWTARYVPPDKESFQPSAAHATADGGLLVGGAATQRAYAFVLRLGADGRVEWARRLDASNRDNVRDVIETRDGGVVCAGYNRESPWLAKLSAKGDLEWQQIYRTANGRFDSVIETTDGDLIAAGSSVLIVRTTSKGATKWQKALKQDVDSSTLAPMPNGSFALSLTGTSASWLLAFGGDGSLLWQKSFTPGEGVVVTSPSLGATDLVSTPSGLFYGPPLRRLDNRWNETTLLFRAEADGKTDCPWFTPSNIPIADAAIRPESLPLVFEPLTFEKKHWDTRISELSVEASPITCTSSPAAAVSAPTAVPPANTSTFDRYAALRAKARLWEELRRTKDFAQLETIAAQLRANPWSSDPLHWDIGRFYETLGSTDSMDEADVLATLRDWAVKQPQSITPKLALSQALHDAGWKRRGSGTSATITSQDSQEYEKFLDESHRTLMTIKGGEGDPHYWGLLALLAHHRGVGDGREIARRAAKYTHDPDVFLYAGVNLLPQWSGRGAEYRPFAEEAAVLTRSTMGDGLYTWLAYQARFTMGEESNALGFDWPRVNKGARDLIRMAPNWIPTYHRLALMARWANDRATAREMFLRPELDWYEGATSMWSRPYYDGVRDWALRTPAETFLNSRPQTPSAPPSTPARQSASVPPAPKPPVPVPATKLKKAPSTDELSSVLPSEWPQIVMQNNVVLDGTAQPPLASFLVETSSGVVAVSAVPAVRSMTEGDSFIEYTRSRLTAWTMASSLLPKRVLKVQTIDTRKVPEYQRGVALALAPTQGNLPVHVLKLYPPEAPPALGRRVFVVACQWAGGRCIQSVVSGKIESANGLRDSKYITHSIRLDKGLDPAAYLGAAVLDEDGYAIAVMNGRASTMTPSGPLLDAEDLKSVVNR